MATTSRAPSTGFTPRSCTAASRRSSGDLPQSRLRRLFPARHGAVLAPAAARAEHPAPRRQLFLLRLRAPVVPDPDRDLHVDRLLRGAVNGGVAGPPDALPPDEHRLELRDARLLQVLQLLRGERRAGA